MNKILRVLQCSLLILGCTLAIPGQAFAESVTLMPIVIIELQTASATSGKDEFIELYNPNSQAVDISDWQAQYRAASKTGETAKDWQQLSTTITCPVNDTECTTVINARGRLTLASAGMELAHQPLLKDGMATESGQLRLISADGLLQDMLGYGTAATAEGSKAAPKLQAGKSLKRRVNEDGVFIDSNNNAADFIGGCTPTPKAADVAVTSCVTTTTIPGGTTDEPNDSESGNNTTDPADGGETTHPATEPTATLVITEVLPDPAAPQQDEEDEFIELYNPSGSELSLEGYKLQSGNDYRYSYTLAEGSVAAHGYLVVMASASHLTLSNSGGKVRLINPAGGVDDEVSYGAAKEGQSWMRDNTIWSWTTTPTPGTANILTAPASKLATIAVAKTVTAKKAAATTTPKAKTAAVPKAVKPKTSQAASIKTPDQPVEAAVPRGLHVWILVSVALAVMGYAIYEYRQNIARIWLRLRRPRNSTITKTELAENE